MNWTDFQKMAYDLTGEEIDKLAKQVLEQYQAAYEAIAEQLKNQYAKLLTGVKPEDYYNEMLKFNRLAKMQADIKSMYMEFSNKAGLLIQNISYVGFSNSYYRAQYAASWLADFNVGMMPPALAEFVVYGTKSSWDAITSAIKAKFGNASLYKAQSGTIMQFLSQNANKEIIAIQNAITQGLLQGKSYNDMADSIQNIIGIAMMQDGEYSVTGAMANAMRIIITESGRTMNAGHFANSLYLENLGINVKKMILSVLDWRTRRQSARVDSQKRLPSEPFDYPPYKGQAVKVMYPGNSGIAAYDIRDREVMVDTINDEDPQLRTGRNPQTGENETFSFKNFDEWAKENGLKRNKYGELLS